MADATAWIVVGLESGGFGSDHFDPTHLLVLSENDRASWRLFGLAQVRTEDGTLWVPSSPDAFVHDAMLMIAIHIVKDEKLIEAASRVIPDITGRRVDLNLPDRSSELRKLYDLCRPFRGAVLVVTVLAQSTMARSLEDFSQYANPTRICMER